MAKIISEKDVHKGMGKTDFNSIISSLMARKPCFVDTIYSDGSTILTNAVRNATIEVVKLVLAKGANINYQEKGGGTPLLLAIHLNRLDMVRCLVAGNADVNLGDSYDSPLSAAIRRRNTEIAALLLEKGANKNGMLVFAMKDQCNLDTIRSLIEHGLDVNESGAPITWAAANGKIELLTLLISSGADINVLGATGNTALATAVRFKQLETVKYLIEKGANFCKVRAGEGKTPFSWAIHNEDLDMIKSLLDNGFEYIIDAVFLDAIATGNLKIVQLLTERGALIQIENKTDETVTPLQKSLDTGSIEIVKYLLDNGANVVDDLGKNEISMIIQLLDKGKIEIVKLLTESGARVCELSDCGETPLTKAIQLENLDMVKYFLAHGVDVNQPNTRGLSPLVIADSKRAFQIFQCLVDCGASLNEEDQARNPKLARCYKVAKEGALTGIKRKRELNATQEKEEMKVKCS